MPDPAGKGISRVNSDKPTIDSTSHTSTFLGRLLNSDALVVALGTLAGYGFSFAHEAGACLALGVPLALIQLNLTTAFATVALVISLLITEMYNNFQFTSWLLRVRTEGDAAKQARKTFFVFLTLVITQKAFIICVRKNSISGHVVRRIAWHHLIAPENARTLFAAIGLALVR
jgi:hypothetical protein